MGVLPVVNENDTLAVAVCIRQYVMFMDLADPRFRKSNLETMTLYQL